MRGSRGSVPQCHESRAECAVDRYAAAVRALAAWLPAIAIAVLIFTLSAQPNLAVTDGAADLVLRKLAHMAVSGCSPRLRPGPPFHGITGRAALAGAATLALALRVSDEFHQTFVTGRLRLAERRRHRPRRLVVALALLARNPRLRARIWRPRDALLVSDGAFADADAVFAAAVTHLAAKYAAIRPLAARRRAGRPGRGMPALDAWAGDASWRTELVRFYEASAPVLLRPDPELNALLRRARKAGHELTIVSPLPRAAVELYLSQLGVRRMAERRAGRGGRAAARRPSPRAPSWSPRSAERDPLQRLDRGRRAHHRRGSARSRCRDPSGRGR